MLEPESMTWTHVAARSAAPKKKSKKKAKTWLLTDDPSLLPCARFGHSASLYGLDTVQMESTFGPMQQGQMFVRSLLQQLGGSVGS